MHSQQNRHFRGTSTCKLQNYAPNISARKVQCIKFHSCFFFFQHYYKFYRERITFSLQRSPLGRLLRPIWQNWSVSTTRSLHFYFILKNTNFKAKWTIFSYLGIHANSLSLPPLDFIVVLNDKNVSLNWCFPFYDLESRGKLRLLLGFFFLLVKIFFLKDISPPFPLWKKLTLHACAINCYFFFAYFCHDNECINISNSYWVCSLIPTNGLVSIL